MKPSRRRVAVLKWTGSSPSTAIVPPSGASCPVSRLIAVLLPDPLGPISPKISPSRTCRVRSSRTTWSSNALRTPRASIASGFAPAGRPAPGARSANPAPPAAMRLCAIIVPSLPVVAP